MAMPETKIGLFPDVGATYFLSRAKDALGLYIGLTSNVIDGADAIHAKLADLYMGKDAQATFMQSLVEMQWSSEPLRDVVNLAQSLATPANAIPASPLAAADATISKHFVGKRNVLAIVESLQGETNNALQPWAQKIAADILLRSPTMLEVTKRQIENGHTLSISQSLRLEYNMMMQVFDHPDVVEGIRALAIDKDNQPRWIPALLQNVSSAGVDAFFAPRWAADAHPLFNLEALYG